MAAFAWTRKGKRIHISDDALTTRCGWPALTEPYIGGSIRLVHVDADDVVYFGVCASCRRDDGPGWIP